MLYIAILFTGGTIGSADRAGTVDVDRGVSARLLQRYEEQYGTAVRFFPQYPMNLLSENMTPRAWEPLCEAVAEVDVSAFDGVIVAHGSDTLSYTAAALGMLFGDIRVPLVMIAANAAPDKPESNAVDNLHDAVCFIASRAACGVFVAYEHEIHLATRLLPADSYADRFGDYGGRPLGVMREDAFVYAACPQNPTLSQLNAPRQRWLPQLPVFEQPVLMLTAYPGMEYTAVDLGGATRVVLQILYHAATGCTEGTTTSLTAFVQRCRSAGITVYLASFKAVDGAQYATARALLKAGAVPLENISPQAAYVKLLIAYNQRLVRPEALMKQNLYYEILPRP